MENDQIPEEIMTDHPAPHAPAEEPGPAAEPTRSTRSLRGAPGSSFVPVELPENEDNLPEDDGEEGSDSGSSVSECEDESDESEVSDSAAEEVSKHPIKQEESKNPAVDMDAVVGKSQPEETKPVAAAAPRRSRRKNFGNLYDQAILKEKEDTTKPALRATALEPAAKEWDPDEDSEADDADFRPDAPQNGTGDSDQSAADSNTSSSDDEDKDKDNDTTNEPRKHHRPKDPLNAIVEQKRSLDKLLDEIARSPKLQDVKICSVCLWDECDVETDAVVQCDSCGVPVHEKCYGVVGKELEEVHAEAADPETEGAFETMPWFCDPCRFGEKNPQCIACPNRYGAFKQTVKGDWIHGSCARYIREVYFDDEDRLVDVALTDLPYVRWGDKPCVVCEDVFAKNAGVTIQCEAGMCRKHLHATCAMMVGTAAEMEEEMGHPFGVYCADHCPKEDRASNRRCFLAALGLQRKHQMEVKNLSEAEKKRMDLAEAKQRELYVKHRNERTMNHGMEQCARPLHSAYWLMMKGHERAEALGWDAKPVVNPNPNADNVRSSRPDFRPEFVAYIYKREKQISEYLERMEAAKETRREMQTNQGKFDPTMGKSAAKRYASELKYQKTVLSGLLSPFLEYMEKKPEPNKNVGNRGRIDGRSPMKGRVLEPRCQVCESSSFPQRMVQCDDCKAWHHLKCLDPPLESMPNRGRGIKWLCSECAPSDYDSSEPASETESVEGTRKRRRLQGQNPTREKQQEPPVVHTSPKRQRKPFTKKMGRPKKVILDGSQPGPSGEGTSRGEGDRVGERSERKAPEPKKPKEVKSGICCKCRLVGTEKDAVECDKCKQWYHFATCLEPPMNRSPRGRFYGWLCADCSSADEDEDLLE